ncbi:hypothetical protein PVAP13_9KG245439 [Panicum virgatum]|uniref:Uncharacterized protein n=1 Tax=Panicum virgatum TaxID=38727 RepID=A0A8T0NM89_PANVG|nr:hypothetical protein PVAP13_9KG245439 [Panicum virgatum]
MRSVFFHSGGGVSCSVGGAKLLLLRGGGGGGVTIKSGVVPVRELLAMTLAVDPCVGVKQGDGRWLLLGDGGPHRRMGCSALHWPLWKVGSLM